MAQVTWTISGSVSVAQIPSYLRENNSTNAPLSGLTVKVYAKEGIRWNSWGTVKTRTDGTFFMTRRKDRSRRKFRILVQFGNRNMVIYGENKSVLSKVLAAHNHPINIFTSENIEVYEAMLDHVSRATYKSDFYMLYEGRNRLDSGVRTLNRGLVITSSSAPDIEAGLAHKHALIWHTTDKLRLRLAATGLPFRKKIAIKYPHSNKLIGDRIESSYASPLNNCVYLCRNSQKEHLLNRNNEVDPDTLYHELMHIWAYNYSSGEDGMAVQLIKNQSTHDGIQDKAFVAFHESFAEFSARYLLNDIFQDPYFSFQSVPLSRAFLRSVGVTESYLIDKHEQGWNHIFNTLTCLNIEQYNLNFGSSQARLAFENFEEDFISLNFEQILQTFNRPRPFKTSQMRVTGFLKRVMATVGGFDMTTRNTYLRLFDPQDTINAFELITGIDPKTIKNVSTGPIRRRLRRPTT